MDDFRLEISAILVKLPLTVLLACINLSNRMGTSAESTEKKRCGVKKRKKEIPSARVKKIRKIKSHC